MTYPCDGRLGLPPIMLFKTQSASVYGIDAYLVEVEVDVGSARMQDFNVVGLPDNAVKESRERTKPALRNCGFEFPQCALSPLPALLHRVVRQSHNVEVLHACRSHVHLHLNE